MREVLKLSYGDDNPQVPRLLDTVKPSEWEVGKAIKFLDTVGFHLYKFLFYFRKIYIVFK